MNGHIHYFDKSNLLKKYNNLISENESSKYSLYKNNNDTFKILLSALLNFKSFIISIYNYITSYKISASMKQFIFKFQFILLLFILFSSVITFEENSNISTNLIISAYFKKNHLTFLSSDMLEEQEKLNLNNNLNFEKCDKLLNKNEKEKIYGKYIHDDGTYNKKNHKSDNKNMKVKSNEQLFEEMKNRFQSHMHKGNLELNKDREYFLFYNMTIKYILIIFLSFSLLYSYIKFTLTSKIRTYLVFNLICIFISFNLLYALYINDLYLPSNFFFILLIYIYKNLIDSIYLRLNYKRKDFEIFSTSLMAIDSKQFNLKFIILLSTTILSGILSIFFFRALINYIVFYICLFTLIVFLSNCIEPIIPFYFRPIKNIIIFSLGIINFIFSKFILKFVIYKITLIIQNNYINYFKKNKNSFDMNFRNDSLYFISDLFSLFCFDYIRGYLEFKIELYLLVDNYIENNKIKKNKIKKEILNQLGVWLLLLLLSLLIGIVGIFKNEYMCLIMSIYLIKNLMNYFCNFYTINLSRFLYYLNSIFFLIINITISVNNNTYLINLFYSFTNIDKDILSFLLKFITLMFLSYYIVVINIILFNSSNNDNFKCGKEIKDIKQDSQDSNIYHIEIENVPITFAQKYFICVDIVIDCFINYLIICIITIIFQKYENNIILRLIYALLVIIFQFIKTIYINKIKNSFEYCFHFFVWFFFSLRLIRLSNTQLSLIFVNHINFLLFLIYYFLNPKRKGYITIIIILFLASAYYELNSYIFILDIIFTITILFLINIINININRGNKDDSNKNNNNKKNINNNIKFREEKEKSDAFGSMNVYNSLSLLFLLPIFVFFLLQLRFQNYFNFLNNTDKYIKKLMVQIYILYNKVENKKLFETTSEFIEFHFISEIIEGLKKISGNTNNDRN